VLAAEIVGVVLFADLVSGLVHWAEDSYGAESTPVLGRWIVGPNLLHHRDGRAFVDNSWLESSWDLLAVGLLALEAAWWTGLLTWHVWLFVVLGINANQIHKWNHMPRSAVPPPVRWLRACGLLQSPRHHAGHHGGEKNTRYCVITGALNPALDALGWWRLLERLLEPLLGTPRSSRRSLSRFP